MVHVFIHQHYEATFLLPVAASASDLSPCQTKATHSGNTGRTGDREPSKLHFWNPMQCSKNFWESAWKWIMLTGWCPQLSLELSHIPPWYEKVGDPRLVFGDSLHMHHTWAGSIMHIPVHHVKWSTAAQPVPWVGARVLFDLQSDHYHFLPDCSRMGLQYLLAEEGWECCHNIIFPSTNDKANSRNGTTEVMNCYQCTL
jgi:hypothetical protein